MQTGEALGAFALTEPHAGSDAAALRTRAVRSRRRLVVPAGRHEVVDLQRPGGRPLSRVRDGRSGRGYPRHHCVPRRARSERVPVRVARAEDGHPGLPGRGAHLRGLRRPGDRPPRRGGRGLPHRVVRARRGSDLDRGGVRRAGSIRSGGRGPLPRGAPGVRQAAGRPAGAALHARRDGPGRGRRAGTHARGRGGQGPRRAPGRGLVAGQVDRLRHRDAGRHGCRPAVRRRAATRARPASSG